MELPHLGKHCANPSCNKLDFLPFVCNGCNLTFCLDHQTKENHSCPSLNSPQQHVEYTGDRSYPCSIDGCQKRELAPIECHHCLSVFCLNHRLQEAHQCEKLPQKKPEMARTNQHIQNMLDQRGTRPVAQRRLTNPKSVKLAAKVKLMKMKGIAVGDSGIPQSERIFLNIILPKLSGKPPVAMFFSKVWTIGRIIDKIADRANIHNINNEGSPEKLRLFHADTGGIITVASSLTEVLECPESLVYNGSSLILELVPDETEVLPDPEQYKK